MKTLHLTLKRRWFDMILSGEKKEEYREIKPYWHTRLCCGFPSMYSEKDFDVVVFKNGYGKNAPEITIEWKGMRMDTNGKTDWGAMAGKQYFIIELGQIISTNNIKPK